MAGETRTQDMTTDDIVAEIRASSIELLAYRIALGRVRDLVQMGKGEAAILPVIWAALEVPDIGHESRHA